VSTAQLPDSSIRVGIDLVSVERFERLLADHGAPPDDIFTEQELRYCEGRRRRPERLAVRFAAKEAVLKTLGTGMTRGARWIDVEVVNMASGRPTVQLHGEVAALAQRRGLRGLDVSLSHTHGFAIASVVSLWTSSTP